MPIEFNRYDYLYIGDLRRNPYVMWSKENAEWSMADDHRNLLNTLDRYADTIIWMHKMKPIWIEEGHK